MKCTGTLSKINFFRLADVSSHHYGLIVCQGKDAAF